MIAVDVSGARKLGIEDWHREFRWPVHPDMFVRACSEMQEHFGQVARSSITEHQLVLLSSFKAHVFFYQWIHMLMLERAAAGSGESLLTTPDTRFTQLLEESPNAYGNVEAGGVPSVPGVRQRTRAWLGFAKRQLMGGEGRALLGGARDRRKILSFSSYSGVSMAYFEQNGLIPLYVPVEMFFGRKHDAGSEWQELGDRITRGYLDIAERYCGPLTGGQVEKIRRYFGGCLAAYATLFEATVARVRRVEANAHLRVASCSLGSPVHKAVGQAIRYVGGEVVGMCHSNSFGRPNTYAICLNELAICDEYVVGSEAEKQSLSHLMEYYKRQMPSTPPMPEGRVSSLRGFYGLVGATDATLHSTAGPIDSIMIVGAAYVPYQSCWLPGANGLRWLYLEVELTRRLRQEGFKVLYKPHPDRLDECEGIFEGHVDAIIGGRFEETWNQADCILNMSWGTTSHGYALRTCKPYILIDTVGAPWPPAIRSVIERRCMIVGTTIEEADNSVRLDEADLMRCLKLLRNPSLIRQRILESHGEFCALLA